MDTTEKLYKWILFTGSPYANNIFIENPTKENVIKWAREWTGNPNLKLDIDFEIW